MSKAISPSCQRPYGLTRVCRVWKIALSSIYYQRKSHSPEQLGRPQGVVVPTAYGPMRPWWPGSNTFWPHRPGSAKDIARSGPCSDIGTSGPRDVASFG